MKRFPLDADYIIKKHADGFTCQAIAKEVGVSLNSVIRCLKKNGIDTSRRLISFDLDMAIKLFESGVGISGIARDMCLSVEVIRRAFNHAGIKTRNRSEQQFARMRKATPEQRKEWSSHSHNAIRGKPAKRTRLEKMARTKELRCSPRKSPYEDILASMLETRGIEFVAQKAIGIYNCDLAAHPVAVEVWGGHWHWHGEHLARTEKRFNEVMNSGWHIIAIAVNVTSPLTESVADYVTSFIDMCRSNPSIPREYRVIWRAGEFVTRGCLNDDNFSIEPPFTRSRNITNGRYMTIPR